MSGGYENAGLTRAIEATKERDRTAGPSVDDMLPYFSHRPTCELLTHARVLRVAVCTCGLTELIRKLTEAEDE